MSFVKEGSSFDTCKGAFDTLKEGITDLRFYHTASNNIENATYIDNVKVNRSIIFGGGNYTTGKNTGSNLHRYKHLII